MRFQDSRGGEFHHNWLCWPIDRYCGIRQMPVDYKNRAGTTAPSDDAPINATATKQKRSRWVFRRDVVLQVLDGLFLC
jgi:hypothetical protein